MNLMKSEMRKVLYARSYRYLLLGAIALAVLSSAASPYVTHRMAESGELTFNGLTDPQMVSGMYAKAIGGYIIVVIIGVLLMAGEFRHGTAVATFLTAPRRASVLVAKLVVAAAAGVFTMVVSTGIGVVSCWLALQQYPEAVAPAPGTFGHLANIALVSGAVLAIIGVAVGTLIRNQGLAVGITMMWLFLIDRLIAVFWTTGGKFLPTGLITGMMALRLEGGDRATGMTLDTADYLPAGQATAVLIGYGAAFAIVAVMTTLRRDID